MTTKIKWLNNISDVFKDMGPNINSFAKKIIEPSAPRSSTVSSSITKNNKQANTVNLNIKSLNKCIRISSTKMAHLIRILGDYFKIFNGALVKVSNELCDKTLEQSYLSLNL